MKRTILEADHEPEQGLDRIGPDQLLDALAIAKVGKIHELATQLGDDMPQGPRDVFYGFRVTQFHVPQCVVTAERPPADWSTELITAAIHLGTHVDGLMHWQSQGRTFGGHEAREVFGDHGWTAHGMETSRPIIGRGVLLDIPAAKRIPCLPPEYEITQRDLEQCLAVEGTSIRSGDIALVRTGWFATKYETDPAAYFASNPGVGPDAAIWLYDLGISVLGTDTSGTEVIPFPNLARTTHVELLVKRGVHLIEVLDLEAIARDRVYEFLFVGLPLRINGGTGSWLRPVAIT
jgi:kynurenine formamidase